METSFPRSKALNNIPQSKVQERLKSIPESCEECKNKDLKDGDGLCQNCGYKTIAYNRFTESNIPIEYWSIKMEKDFYGDKRLLNKYNDIVKNLKSIFINGTSICFAGSHGVGKSLNATSILKIASLKGFSCLYSVFGDIVNTLTQASNEEKHLARKELMMVDFLVIDELDPRFSASDSSADLFARTLETVFRTRSQNKLPTFICTNSPNVLEMFNGSLKESIGSLMNKLEQFPVLGEDFRKKK